MTPEKIGQEEYLIREIYMATTRLSKRLGLIEKPYI